ncbi:hypothetical protein JCM3775_004157 [Rhodotorula graminis]|uniref:Uncharacterized protein n=1 Tax=Rhodotorula graminis (strain WP1) TaxID=578459 RepID=A0A0N8PZV5_RHOGW|nr:uncharacterized protein RHOBADRAFT_45958 [Rhodotorula graminis WP1]KPV73381.1 hypothetical protein RHOBADRAFT_45958 [Rhodotorula graminis WP1]
MEALFREAAENNTVEQYILLYDERKQYPSASVEYGRLSHQLDRLKTLYKTLLAVRARGYTTEELCARCAHTRVHIGSISAAKVSLSNVMLDVFDDELRRRVTAAASLGVRTRDSVPMTHRMRLLYRGERY